MLLSGNVVGFVQSIGCSDHYSYWMHWPSRFPQHSVGVAWRYNRPNGISIARREAVAAMHAHIGRKA